MTGKKSRAIIFLFISVLVAMFFILDVPSALATTQEKEFKVIGYLPDYEQNRVEDVLEMERFTDINYFSLIPQTDGNLVFTDSGSENNLREIVKLAQKNKVNIGASIGGWGMSDNFSQATNPDNLTNFVKKIVSFAEKNELNTIDIDWEYPAENEATQFDEFITQLKKSLGEVKLSVTVPSGVAANGKPSGRWDKHFLPATLKKADWINIMSYDAQIEGYEHHSPEKLQEENLKYWNEILGGDAMNKLVAGIPFYAKAGDGAVKTYNQIIEETKEVPKEDTVTIQGKKYLFNNKRTIRYKTQQSIELGSAGIMIWAPTMDTKKGSATHLMGVVSKTIEESGVNDVKTESFLHRLLERKEGIKSMAIIFTIIGLLLTALGVLWMLGKATNVFPDQIKGRNINKSFLGRISGFLFIFIGVLIVLLTLAPLWASIIYILAVGLFIWVIFKET